VTVAFLEGATDASERRDGTIAHGESANIGGEKPKFIDRVEK